MKPDTNHLIHFGLNFAQSKKGTCNSKQWPVHNVEAVEELSRGGMKAPGLDTLPILPPPPHLINISKPVENVTIVHWSVYTFLYVAAIHHAVVKKTRRLFARSDGRIFNECRSRRASERQRERERGEDPGHDIISFPSCY